MGFSCYSVLLLAAAFVLVTSKYDEEICEMTKASCGLAPPPLPENFEMKFEQVDRVRNETVYSEVYLDYVNTIGKYMYLSQGVEYHSLFDYQTQQIVKWRLIHSGVDIKKDPLSHKCETVSMDSAPDSYIFGYMDDFTNRPKMYNSNQMLRYGGQYVYAADGSERLEDRGFKTNKFVGCVYDKTIDITMNMTYYFTDEFVVTTAGSLMEPVTGEKYTLLPVPARLDMFSMAWEDENKTIRSYLKRSENVFWFKGEPEFKLHTFKIPPYMYCDGYQGRHEMEPFPTAFDTRIQKTALVRDVGANLIADEITSYEMIFYSQDLRLARRDFTPDPDLDTEFVNKFNSKDPVKTIYDFNEGVLYVTHVPTGRCYARKIEFGDFFETSKQTMYIKMGTPSEVLQMPVENMQYKGTDFVRDIECDVYTGKYYDERYKATYITETYVSTAGWHEEANKLMEYRVPVKHVIMNSNVDTTAAEVVQSYEFFKLMRGPVPLVDFDIGNCIETQKHKDFALLLKVDDEVRGILFDYKTLFLETAQYYLTNVSQVGTPLRVQNLQLTFLTKGEKKPLLHFTLVEKTQLQTRTPDGQKGFSLPEAERAVHQQIDDGYFTISFQTPATKDFIPVMVAPGGMYEKTAGGHLQAISFHPEPQPNAIFADDEQAKDDVQVQKGMSPGGLAGLSIAMMLIGIGIGIAIMYLYIRTHSESGVDSSIGMTHR